MDVIGERSEQRVEKYPGSNTRVVGAKKKCKKAILQQNSVAIILLGVFKLRKNAGCSDGGREWRNE